jgi:transformation/transcription domain-associated protein
VSLQEIFEDHATRNGFNRDDPVIFFSNRLKEACLSEDISQRTKVELVALKAEFSAEIAQKMIPDTIVTNYFALRMGSFEDLWTLRKRFTTQMACITFMTYLLSIGQRSPQKFYISQEKGSIWTSDFYSCNFYSCSDITANILINQF